MRTASSHSFGQVMFQQNIISGLIFLSGILINNRLMAIYAVYAAILGSLAGWLFSSPISAINAGLMGYNGILCAIALTGKKRSDFLWITLAVILSTVLNIGLAKTGIITLTAPFVLATWVILILKNSKNMYQSKSLASLLNKNKNSMTLKLISATLLFGLFLTSCDSVKKATDATHPDNHSSQNSLDWQGSYSGVTPCASCPGIETELTLTSDQNYVLTNKYVDNEGIHTVKGKFAWKGNSIQLDGIKDGDGPSLYKVEEGRVRQLDLKGKEFTGQLAQNYVLTKNGNLAVEDKRWKLIELFGKPITGNAQPHYIIFHSKDGKLEAKANCNVILNNYKIKNQYRLNITPGISTLMACPDNLEQELAKALEQADNLSVSETNLSLNKARMAPLARFELVKK